MKDIAYSFAWLALAAASVWIGIHVTEAVAFWALVLLGGI